MNKKAEKILETTTRLFLRDGIKKITMDEIAEAAKVSKVTIYKYFADKDTLYLYVGRRLLAAAAAALQTAVTLPKPLAGRLQAVLGSLSAFTDSGGYALCGALAAYNHAVDAELAAYRQACEQALYALIDEGMAAGVMKRGLDREMIFRYVDMGVAYYRQNAAYRAMLHGDAAFRTRYMRFVIGNIFENSAAVYPDV